MQDHEWDGDSLAGELRRDLVHDVGPGERQHAARRGGVEFLVGVRKDTDREGEGRGEQT